MRLHRTILLGTVLAASLGLSAVANAAGVTFTSTSVVTPASVGTEQLSDGNLAHCRADELRVTYARGFASGGIGRGTFTAANIGSRTCVLTNETSVYGQRYAGDAYNVVGLGDVTDSALESGTLQGITWLDYSRKYVVLTPGMETRSQFAWAQQAECRLPVAKFQLQFDGGATVSEIDTRSSVGLCGYPSKSWRSHWTQMREVTVTFDDGTAMLGTGFDVSVVTPAGLRTGTLPYGSPLACQANELSITFTAKGNNSLGQGVGEFLISNVGNRKCVVDNRVGVYTQRRLGDPYTTDGLSDSTPSSLAAGTLPAQITWRDFSRNYITLSPGQKTRKEMVWNKPTRCATASVALQVDFSDQGVKVSDISKTGADRLCIGSGSKAWFSPWVQADNFTSDLNE